MKVLVTGGTGFIGSHLVKRLKQHGHNVDTLSIDMVSNNKNHVHADITDRKAMLSIIPRYDMAYHLAGLLGTSELITQAYEASRVNILGTVNILDGALKNKTKVLYVTKPNCWLNTYSITKYAGESFAKMHNEQFGLPTISVKWFNVYGPNQSFHCQKAVPFFIRWALQGEPIDVWGNGEQTMDLIHAVDAVNATVLVGEDDLLQGQTIDIGSGIETSVNDLAKMIIKHLNSKSTIRHLPMRDGETPDTKLRADTEAVRKLGFQPTVDLYKGMGETINWYKERLKL